MTEKNQSLAAICWVTTAILAGFMCFTQAGMMLCMLVGRVGIGVAAPVALFLSIVAGHFLGQQMGLTRRQQIWPPVLALCVMGFGLAFSAFYFDLSWDGQWYHQTGIYALASDWNPLTDPMRAFPQPPSTELWVRHYPKGTWYVAAAIFDAAHRIEWGKCINILSWAAMGLAAFAAALDYDISRGRSAAIAVVMALNPVVMSEITTYMVDGVMISFLVVVAAALFSLFRRPRSAVISIGLMAAIVSINAKFTGLVFLCILLAAGGLWCAWRERKWLLPYSGLSLLGLFLGVCVWGYNPYVTNTLHRHNPFYPLSGNATFPSLDDQGKQGIELYETPKNFLPYNRFSRLFLATFGQPGNQPYHKEPDARLMWPFAARWGDLFYYHYHETRVAGFGPWFSGALLLSLGLTVWALLRCTSGRATMILTALTILASLISSPYFWWARYGPQLWLLPILPAILIFRAATSRWAVTIAWLLVALLAVNASIVAVVRLKWETIATQTQRRQLIDLRDSGRQYAFYIPRFGPAVEGRLKAWGVNYVIGEREQVGTGPRLITIVDDYPLPVRYRVVPQAATQPAN